MNTGKDNKGLLDKRNFQIWKEEKKRWLKTLSLKKAIRLQESLLSSDFVWIWRKNFSLDRPICLAYSLRKRR